MNQTILFVNFPMSNLTFSGTIVHTRTGTTTTHCRFVAPVIATKIDFATLSHVIADTMEVDLKTLRGLPDDVTEEQLTFPPSFLAIVLALATGIVVGFLESDQAT